MDTIDNDCSLMLEALTGKEEEFTRLVPNGFLVDGEELQFQREVNTFFFFFHSTSKLDRSETDRCLPVRIM